MPSNYSVAKTLSIHLLEPHLHQGAALKSFLPGQHFSALVAFVFVLRMNLVVSPEVT